MSNEDIIASLNPVATGVARAFLASHPDAILTSGKRTVADQAHAMAENVVLNWRWIAQTYVQSDLSRALQNHVAALQPDDRTPENLANGFAAIMNLSLPAELRRLSWHLAGDGFDVHPDNDLTKEATLRQLIGTAVASGANGKVLTLEGGLKRLHVQVA